MLPPFSCDIGLPYYIKEERGRVEGRVFISSAFRTWFLTYLPEPKVIGLAREASKKKAFFTENYSIGKDKHSNSRRKGA